MLGDGELCEGQVWEAAMAAGHYRAGTWSRIVDRNQLSHRRPDRGDHGRRAARRQFAAFGWHVRRIDGHDFDAILDAFA